MQRQLILFLVLVNLGAFSTIATAQYNSKKIAGYIKEYKDHGFVFSPDSIWNGYSINRDLLKIIVHPKISDQAKLYIDLKISNKLHGTSYLTKKMKEILSELYAKALHRACQEPWVMINNYEFGSWGYINERFLWPGPGARIGQLGKTMIKALYPLLDNDCLIQLNSSYTRRNLKVRVKDYAAYYISHLQGNPLLLGKYKSFAKRDLLILQLKKTLPKILLKSKEELLADFIIKKKHENDLSKSIKDSLWKKHNKTLLTIITHPEIDDQIKLYVDLIIENRQLKLTAFDKQAKRELARLYAKALKMTGYYPQWFYSSGNSWAFIASGHVGLGPGARVMQLGKIIIPELTGLLDDNCIIYSRRDAYYFRFRVKDYAAFLIARIKKIPLFLNKYKSPKKRDELIKKLKDQLSR
ncbi:hypothetical protein M23134_06211 [Microscilla marina ATCC 23134]|uniref:Uncharacterized protein n=2 Tax=Microscilla marina TaxID=1027 RepID=A1ZVT5_MICM2|nr:hypothetical protein M23134_06211 [Microscilla marina ATCC 23134]